MEGFFTAPEISYTRGDNVTPLPKPKKNLRIIHKTPLGSFGALFFDINGLDDGFTLPVYVQAVRAAGYILNDTLYVPADEIAGMFVWTEDKPPQPMNVVQFEGKKT